MNYEAEAAACRQRVEAALAQAIPAGIPEPLYGAMRYALLTPGKRLRPMLLLKAHEMLAPAGEDVVPFAMAMEMIHAYSLVHDDLPAMDNDTLRRGQPTCHVAYGEAMAILAGDGLLNLAHETMLNSLHPRAFRAAVTAGLILAGADEKQQAAGSEYGLGLGRAFQIIDDLLDLNSDAAMLGKTPGKDLAAGKLTWPAAVGEQQAREDARIWTERAVDALAPFGESAGFLRETALRALNRIR